jgi:RHS repeat-associated protein
VSDSTGLTTMTYDNENRLKVHVNGAVLTTYAYQYDGMKRTESVGSSLTTIIWDGSDYLQGRAWVMAVTNYHTVNGRILGETTGGVRTDYLTDALGSVTATVNPSAQVVNRYTYKPYGGLLAKTGVGADPVNQWVGSLGYRQAGKKYSEVYVRARHYDTANGRWSTKDPLGLRGGDMNLYRYVANRSTLMIDPTGLVCTPEQVKAKNLQTCQAYCAQAQQGDECNISSLTFNPKTDCPKDNEFELIRMYCKVDHGQQVTPAPDLTQAETGCCCIKGNIDARTIFHMTRFRSLPKVFQVCLWEHELDRRKCCFENCSSHLNPEHHKSQMQLCVWESLSKCYPDARRLRQLFPDCIPEYKVRVTPPCSETGS